MRVLFFMCMGPFLLPIIAAAEDSSGRPLWRQRAVVAAGQTVNGDYIAAAPRVVISGTVNGDVYVAGGTVLVDGVINGDLIVAAAKIILSGRVSHNARIAGAHAVLSGHVGRSVAIGAADVQMTETGRIDGAMLVAGGDVEVEGPVAGDVKIAAGKVLIAHNVGRDLVLAAGAGRLTSRAVVEGRLRYWGDAPAIDEGARIRGAVIHRSYPEGWEPEGIRRALMGLRVTAAVVSFSSTLVLGLLLLGLYPVFTRQVTSTIRSRPLRSLGWGTAALIGIPLTAALFAMTVLGLPIGMMLLALYVVLLYLSRIYAMTCVGQLLIRRPSESAPLFWSFIAGLGVYTLLSLIPIVGEVVMFMTVLFGIGALLLAETELVATLRKEQVV